MFMLALWALSPAVAPVAGTVARLYTGTESADHGGGSAACPLHDLLKGRAVGHLGLHANCRRSRRHARPSADGKGGRAVGDERD